MLKLAYLLILIFLLVSCKNEKLDCVASIEWYLKYPEKKLGPSQLKQLDFCIGNVDWSKADYDLLKFSVIGRARYYHSQIKNEKYTYRKRKIYLSILSERSDLLDQELFYSAIWYGDPEIVKPMLVYVKNPEIGRLIGSIEVQCVPIINKMVGSYFVGVKKAIDLACDK